MRGGLTAGRLSPPFTPPCGVGLLKQQPRLRPPAENDHHQQVDGQDKGWGGWGRAGGHDHQKRTGPDSFLDSFLRAEFLNSPPDNRVAAEMTEKVDEEVLF